MDLDVSRFSREALYEGARGEVVDLAKVVRDLQPTFDTWAEEGKIKQTDSFGFAAAHHDQDLYEFWDDPYALVWFVVGWGPEGDRFIANAVRKLRPLARVGFDTLQIRLFGDADKLFEDKVESQEADGSFKWGDFPWGGATYLSYGNYSLPCAISCYKEVEDDTTAKTAGGHMGMTMLKLDNPAEFAD